MTLPKNTGSLDAEVLRSVFDRVYVINLPERTDRRREISAQLRVIGMALDDPLIQLFAAVRPSDAGGFRTVGARGCFLSHLAVLRDAREKGHRSILILEDDVDWTSAALTAGGGAAAALRAPWMFLHGGVEGGSSGGNSRIRLERVPPDEALLLAHFVGLRGAVIAALVPYLEAILERPAGSPEGGPMDVDGAYSWFRRSHPEVATCLCVPPLARQRSSRSDITEPKGWRAWPVADWGRRVLRPIRTGFRR